MEDVDEMAVRLAASLGLADASRPVDLRPSRGEGLRRSQTYLVGKLMTARAFNKRSFMGMFRRAWRLNGRYTVQEHDDRFLFTLSDPTDRNRILRGGPWGFDRAPVVLAPYDGVGAIKDVPFTTLAFWIKVRGLPPDFHTDRCLRRIGSAIGRFVQKDTTEFDAGRIQIRVEVDLLQPIIFRRSFTVDDGIVVDLEFFFENLYGRCKDCGLVTHVGLPCSGTPLPAELQTDTPLARRNLERVLNQVGVIQPAGPVLVFGAQNTPQIGLERFMPPVKPKVRKEIRRRPSVGSGDGSFGVQTDSNATELDGGSEPKSDGSVKGFFGASSSTEHAPNHAMLSPGGGMRRKRVDEDGISPKKMRLSLAIGRTNLDAMIMGLCNVKPAEQVYKKRGRPKGTKNKTKEIKMVQASPMNKSPSKKSKSPRKLEKLVNGLPEFTLVEIVNGSNPSKGKEPIVA